MLEIIKKSAFFIKMLIIVWILSQIDMSFAIINTQWSTTLNTGIQWSWKSIDIILQDILSYVIGFLYIIAVMYWIYGWILIVTAAGDEEKVKKWKTVIINVLIWLIVIFIISSIINWVLNLFTATQ